MNPSAQSHQCKLPPVATPAPVAKPKSVADSWATMAAVTCSLQRGRRSHWWRSHRDDPNDNEKEEDGGSLQSEEEEEEEEEEEAASDGSWASEEDLPLPGGAVPMDYILTWSRYARASSTLS